MFPLSLRPSVVVVWGAILLWLTSCNTERIPPGPPADGEVGAACSGNEACQLQNCLADPSFGGGYCTKDCPEADPTCPDGASCSGYLGYKMCLRACGEGECREGYVCDYGVCRPPCGTNTCVAPDVCLLGRCKAGCKLDSECSGGLRCQDGKCVPPCKADAECTPGYSCNQGTGRCEPKPGKKLGEGCAASGECATGHCLPERRFCSIKCTASAACPVGYTCGLEKFHAKKPASFDAVEADCVPLKGKVPAGGACGVDDDCASQHCYNGFCMEGCAADGDCAAALQCVEVNILLDGAIPKYKGCLPRKGTSTFTLATNAATGVIKGLDVPPNAASFVLTTEVASTTELGAVTRLADPANAVLYESNGGCDSYSQPIRYFADTQYSSLYVPNTPAVALKPGVYTYVVGTSQQNLTATVRVQLKLGRADKGTLNINWFFLNLAGTCVPGAALNAAAAPTHSWFGKTRNNMVTILKSAGLTVGKETFQDLKNAALDTITMPQTGSSAKLDQLFASSKGLVGNALNIFLVRKIEIQGTIGGVILGIAGGIPGPLGVHGTVHSGLAMSMETACFEPYGYNPGHTLAHEAGHYLGLFHNQEAENNPGLDGTKVVCPCPCGMYMSCTQNGGISWCRGEDPIPDTTMTDKNLMFYAAESTQMFDGNQLSPGQIRVLLDSPLVGH